MKVQALSILMGFFLTLGSHVMAASKPFDAEKFQSAQHMGKHVVLQFHADWCPTCQKQKKALQKLVEDKAFGDIEVFEANFDQESDLKKRLGVKGQSTLIYFVGEKEVDRSQGVTDSNRLMADFKQFLMKR